jgi:hypothetical protein
MDVNIYFKLDIPQNFVSKRGKLLEEHGETEVGISNGNK